MGFPGGGKESAYHAGTAGDVGSITRLRGIVSPGGGHGNPLQYSCLENPMDRGAWQAIVHGVAKGWRRLSDEHFHFSLSSLSWGPHRAGQGRL